MWGDAAPVGRRFRLGDGASNWPWNEWLTVVGVADEVHEVAFSLQENLFEIYLPWSTHTPADDAYLVARGADRRTTVQALRQSLSAVAPDVPMRA